MADQGFGITRAAARELTRVIARNRQQLPATGQRTRRVWPSDPDGLSEIPGKCSCCGGCVCYPSDEADIITVCTGFDCLLREYSITGAFPWTGETAAAHDTLCIWNTDSYAINQCDIDFGTHYWKLTVSNSRGMSKVELIRSGSAGDDIPLVYWADNFFHPLCGNEFHLAPWCPDTANLKLLWDRGIPNKICVNPGVRPTCRACETGGEVQTECCPNPIPANIRLTFTSDPDPVLGDLCPDMSGEYIDITYSTTTFRWEGSGTVCGETVQGRMQCISNTMYLSLGGGPCVDANISSAHPASGGSCNPFSLTWTAFGHGNDTCACCTGPSGRYIVTATPVP